LSDYWADTGRSPGLLTIVLLS